MSERGKRTSLPSLAGDSLLLICALAGFIASFLTLYGNPETAWMDSTAQWQGSTPLDLCAGQLDSFLTLSVVLALAGLAVWSLPRFQWAAAGGLAALLGLCVCLNWDNVVHGAGLTLHTVTAIFSQRVSWGWTFPYDPALTASERGAVTRLFLSLVLALLALLLGWAIVRAKRWWIVLLFTLPPLLPGLLADLYPGWLPFMALAACWCAMLLTDLCKWAAPSGRGWLTLVVLPCVAAVLAVITLMFPQEDYTRPEWARHMENRVYDGASRLADLFSQFDGPFQGRVTYVGSAEEADLTSAGPLNYSGRTVLRVRSDYEGRLYLRGSSLAVYAGGVWKALPDEVYQEYKFGTFPLFFPAIMTENGSEHTVSVDNVGAVGTCVYAPYFLPAQDLEENGMSPVNDSLLARRQGRWSHTISFVELDPPEQSGSGVHFAAGGLPVEDVISGKANFGDYASFVLQHYLDVPEEYRNDLARFSMENGVSDAARYGSGYNPVQAAQEVADLLGRFYEYDPETPAPPPGEDPVAYFLTESRRGYCMHFASAATLMLRSLGIPARYVSGFTVDSVPDREVTVPDRAAHAWVEVWAGGFGWYPVEVTPAAAFSWYEQGAVLPEDLPSVPLPESEEPEPTPTPSQDIAVPSVAPGAPQGGDDGPVNGFNWTVVLGIVKALAAIIGAAALLWLGQYLPKRLRAKRLGSPDRNRAALDGYGYLCRMERWGGRMDERAVELAQKARFSQHTLTREELGELKEFVDHERERLCVILDPLPRLAFRYFWGLPLRPKTGENAENPGEKED